MISGWLASAELRTPSPDEGTAGLEPKGAERGRLFYGIPPERFGRLKWQANPEIFCPRVFS